MGIIIAVAIVVTIGAVVVGRALQKKGRDIERHHRD